MSLRVVGPRGLRSLHTALFVFALADHIALDDGSSSAEEGSDPRALVKRRSNTWNLPCYSNCSPARRFRAQTHPCVISRPLFSLARSLDRSRALSRSRSARTVTRAPSLGVGVISDNGNRGSQCLYPPRIQPPVHRAHGLLLTALLCHRLPRSLSNRVPPRRCLHMHTQGATQPDDSGSAGVPVPLASRCDIAVVDYSAVGGTPAKLRSAFQREFLGKKPVVVRGYRAPAETSVALL